MHFPSLLSIHFADLAAVGKWLTHGAKTGGIVPPLPSSSLSTEKPSSSLKFKFREAARQVRPAIF
jgi:hypothetical protein